MYNINNPKDVIDLEDKNEIVFVTIGIFLIVAGMIIIVK